jgi:hypothetical protein
MGARELRDAASGPIHMLRSKHRWNRQHKDHGLFYWSLEMQLDLSSVRKEKPPPRMQMDTLRNLCGLKRNLALAFGGVHAVEVIIG